MDWHTSIENFWSWIIKIWNLKLFTSGANDIHLNQILIAMLTIYVGIYLTKRFTMLVGKRLEKFGKIDHQTAFVLQKVFSYVLFVIVVLVAMPIAGIPITIFTRSRWCGCHRGRFWSAEPVQ